MKFGRNLRKKSTEQLSQRIFYGLLAITMLVFCCFFLIGYDEPFVDNPDFNAPLFTDVLILLMWVLFLGSVSLSVYSIIKDYRTAPKNAKDEDGIPEAKINHFVWGGTAVALVLTFLVSSSTSMIINGKPFSDWIWLKVSDMFIFTSILLLVIAFGAVVFGATRYIRRERK